MLKSNRAPRAAAIVAAVAAGSLLLAACGSSGGKPQRTVTKTSSSGSVSPSNSAGASSTSASVTAPPAKPVHVQGYPDGSKVGVGMPIIATFNHKISSGVGFQKGTKVTVNGKPVQGNWYFEYSDPKSGHKMEAHYRLKSYWPAHSHIHVAFTLKGVSAGRGLAFDGKLTSLDFTTGARNVSTVDDATHKMTVTSDGKKYGTFPVSLGANNTPTARGTKVIMEKGASICMSGPGYNECGIKYTQRLTYGGEYLHAAPWNISNINNGIDSSNGCTNLLPSDAQRLYGFLRVGDVVIYPNANGPAMSLGAGYGDWNVDWGQWQTGGAAKIS